MDGLRVRRFCRSAAVVAGVLAGASEACAFVTPDAELTFNQQFLGLISGPADADFVAFDEVAGSAITIRCTRDGTNLLKPELTLLDAAEAPIAVGAAYHQGAAAASIDDFMVPYSGTYFVKVGTKNGHTGTYKLTVKGKPKKQFTVTDSIAMVGEVDGLAFASRADGKLTGKIDATSGGLLPALIELVAPNGNLVAIADRFHTKHDGATIVLDGIALPQLGEYSLRVTGAGGTTGGFVAKLEVAPPKPAKGKVGEDEYPKKIPEPAESLRIVSVAFGRGLRTADGSALTVVSPFTTVETDPISDLPVEGTLEPVFPNVDLDATVSFGLGPLFFAPIVPRNAVLVVHFDKKVSEQSLHLDAARLTTAETPFTLTVNGAPVTVEVFVQGKDVVLNPVVGDVAGFPASPVALSQNGDPVADPAGGAKLDFTSKGADTIKSVQGGGLDPRGDLLGTSDAGGAPIAFNTGNEVLDFFMQFSAGATATGFNGFLPDKAAPRLIREYGFTGAYAPINGDSLGAATLNVVLDVAYDTTSNDGRGEWANGVVRLRPNGPNLEQLVIVRNQVQSLGDGQFLNIFELAKNIVIPLAAGQEYQVLRAEYFEPDPAHPIDPELWDPDDPQALANTDIRQFALVRDRNGVAQDVTQPIDPLSSFSFLFSEPMLESSLRPWESLYVSDDEVPEGEVSTNYVAKISLSQAGKRATYAPVREVQFGAAAGTVQAVGFGPVAKNLRFHMRVVPRGDVLAALLGDGFDEFVREGERGITDAGGQPLAFPLSLISAAAPTIDFEFAFATAADPALVDHGAIVMRFKGQPITGFDADLNPGVSYRDLPPSLCGPKGNFFGPAIADLNLFTNGFLSGAPVQFIQKIHDDLNPPPTGQMTAYPGGGASTPIGGNSVLGGAKLQHVYRPVDCSPDAVNLAGTVLDLVQLSFAPAGGSVITTTLPDFSIHAGHTTHLPDTTQSGGIPTLGNSGLDDDMGGHQTVLGDPSTPYVPGNYNAKHKTTGIAMRRQLCVGSETTPGLPDFYTGRPLTFDMPNLFVPQGSARNYHPLSNAGFDFPFPYDNGDKDSTGANKAHSLLLEYRTTVNAAAPPPSNQNLFTFAVGILSSALPRFRVFTIGSGCTACCPTNGTPCNVSCVNSFTPVLSPALDPDLIKRAAGPDPIPISLSCYCLPAPAGNPGPVPGCTDQTGGAPSIDTVADGTVANPGANNYGDNDRYYMVFDYVKRESLIRSPFARVQPAAVADPTWLAPIFHPLLTQLPVGSKLTIRFRASTNGVGAGDATAYVTPDQMANEVNALNDGAARPFIQFEAVIEANTATQLVPAIEELIIPYRK